MKKLLTISPLLYFAIVQILGCANDNSLSEKGLPCPNCFALPKNEYFLVDRALGYFGRTSIGHLDDSLIRVWVVQEDFPDSPVLHEIRMFEFSLKSKNPFASYHSVSFSNENDSILKVEDIESSELKPLTNWQDFHDSLKVVELGNIFDLRNFNTGHTIVESGLLLLQFVNGNSTRTFNYTHREDLYEPIDENQSKDTRQFVRILQLIDRFFNVRLSKDSKGRDFLTKPEVEIIDAPLLPLNNDSTGK